MGQLRHLAQIQFTSQSRCFFFVISATSSSSKSGKYWNSRLDSQKIQQKINPTSNKTSLIIQVVKIIAIKNK